VFFPELYERVKAIPGVQSVGMNGCAPLSGDGYCDTAGVRFLDRPEVPEGTEPNADFFRAGPGFFETVGVPLIRGRSFDWGDRSGEGRVAIVSEAAATEFWPGEDPIGKWVSLGGREAASVVGIVGDVHYETIETQPKPAVYLASSQNGNYGGYLFLRVQGDPALLANEVRRTVGSMRPNIPAPGVWTLDAQVEGATARSRFSTSLLSLFAAVALAISAIGIFGVLSYLVSKQTRQIGIRMALGAQRGTVFRQVLRRALVMTGIGVGLGGLCYLGLMRFIQTLLFAVQPDDPITLAVIALTLSSVSIAAAYLPAWRAMRVEPVEALKEG
jgi:putative ABC transport system permease protein